MEGVMESGAKLEEINLSDNAFGPAGMEGIKDILASSNCFTLKELRLNNNGLGTFGVAALSKCLIDGYNNSIQVSRNENIHNSNYCPFFFENVTRVDTIG